MDEVEIDLVKANIYDLVITEYNSFDEELDQPHTISSLFPEPALNKLLLSLLVE